jgi:hypothetical protein
VSLLATCCLHFNLLIVCCHVVWAYGVMGYCNIIIEFVTLASLPSWEIGFFLFQIFSDRLGVTMEYV